MAVTAEGARRKERVLCLFDVDGTLTPARQVGRRRSGAPVGNATRTPAGPAVGCAMPRYPAPGAGSRPCAPTFCAGAPGPRAFLRAPAPAPALHLAPAQARPRAAPASLAQPEGASVAGSWRWNPRLQDGRFRAPEPPLQGMEISESGSWSRPGPSSTIPPTQSPGASSQGPWLLWGCGQAGGDRLQASLLRRFIFLMWCPTVMHPLRLALTSTPAWATVLGGAALQCHAVRNAVAAALRAPV